MAIDPNFQAFVDAMSDIPKRRPKLGSNGFDYVEETKEDAIKRAQEALVRFINGE